ncbi:S41 family peptidase [uncultured Pontibacter sp.]|uniref:S41 family peptidase n=1 Tax=uncultured Pontibacter sp. TaxID=453356 RepID=UPI00262CD558|nr:S41 family peptidase [uncultured Pontibacter sp.]
MKKIILLLCLLHGITAFAKPELTENQKLESLAKVWGFLKYYHPEVAKGKEDWDAELMAKIIEVKKAEDQHALNIIYSSWLKKLGKVKKCNRCDNNVPDSLMRNVTFEWLYDSTTFTPELIQQLDYIRKNRNQGKNHYVQRRYPVFKVQAYFKNEKPYTNLEDLPSEEYRLLGLFRYWNIINYYFPYKYAIGQSWDSILADMVPKFRNAADPVAYHLAMQELTASINDGHSYFGSTKHTWKYFGGSYVPFKSTIIDGKAVVTGFYHEGFAKAAGINYGDVITKIEGKPIMEVLEPKLKYMSGSNEAYKLKMARNILFNGNKPTVNVTVERDGKEQELTISRYPFSRFGYKPEAIQEKPWMMLNSDVGYVDLSRLQPKEIKTAMQEIWNSKGIVIDLREYPTKPVSHAVASYLKSENTVHAVMTYPDLKYPGVFRPNTPWRTGVRDKKGYYKGKVVVLVNEGTISAGEFGTMALQTAPDVTVIGSQTAGADGNIVKIVFPGGIETQMSGLGVYYPDGRETQRIGIVPDIEVKPTIAGIQNREDELLDRAILHILSNHNVE